MCVSERLRIFTNAFQCAQICVDDYLTKYFQFCAHLLSILYPFSCIRQKNFFSCNLDKVWGLIAASVVCSTCMEGLVEFFAVALETVQPI